MPGLFFQEVVHEKEEIQFSDFDLWGGGLGETFIDFPVNPLAGAADVAGRREGGREGGATGLERRDLAGKTVLPSQK